MLSLPESPAADAGTIARTEESKSAAKINAEINFFIIILLYKNICLKHLKTINKLAKTIVAQFQEFVKHNFSKKKFFGKLAQIPPPLYI
jgi:hypothetical protein